MTPADDGRFCAHCDRVVVDLTAGPPSAAAATMARARLGDAICVRARVTASRQVLLPAARRRRLTNGIAAVLALSVAGCDVDHPAPTSPTISATQVQVRPAEAPAVDSPLDPPPSEIISIDVDLSDVRDDHHGCGPEEDPSSTIMGEMETPEEPAPARPEAIIPLCFPDRADPNANG